MSVEEIVEATLRMSKLGLVDIYEQANLDERPNLLMVVDQFEELFRYRNLQTASDESHSGEDKSVAFVNLLLEAASSEYPIYRRYHDAVGLPGRLRAVSRPSGSDQPRAISGSAHVARREKVCDRRAGGRCRRRNQSGASHPAGQ